MLEVKRIDHFSNHLLGKLLAVLKQQKRLQQKTASSTTESKGAKTAGEERPKKEVIKKELKKTRSDPDTSNRSKELDRSTRERPRQQPFSTDEAKAATHSGPAMEAKPEKTEEVPVPENEIRTALRSPHIAISGGKVVLDYGSYARPEASLPPTDEAPEMDREQEFAFPSVDIPSYNPDIGYNYDQQVDATAQEDPSSGLSYGKVFGMNAYDYAFEFVPPSYRRHRRHSDSDSESVRNFMSANMPIHGIIEFEEKKPTPLQPMKWISKKARRKSEDQRRKAFPVR